MANYDHLFKLLLIGSSDVGKSSILLRFADDDFDEDQGVTIGVDFKTKLMELGDKKLNLTIWDTVYDVTNKKSFEDIDMWLNEIDLYCTSPDVAKLLVGNKIDKESRQVSREEGLAYARDKAMVYIETSAKTKDGVQTAFEELVQKILDSPSLLEDSRPRVKDNSVDMGQPDPSEDDPGLCGC